MLKVVAGPALKVSEHVSSRHDWRRTVSKNVVSVADVTDCLGAMANKRERLQLEKLKTSRLLSPRPWMG